MSFTLLKELFAGFQRTHQHPQLQSYTRISEWGHQPPGPPPGAPAR